MSVMVTLTKQQVPAYLVGSDFYNSLSGDNDEEFSIPKQYFKPTTSVSSAEELSHFMKTINFWGLKKLSDEIIELLVFKTTEFPETERTKICKVLLELDVEFDLLELYLNVPVSISRKQRFDASVQCGNEHVLEYVYTVDNQVNPTLVKAVALNGHVRLLQQIVHEQGNAPYYYASIPLCTIAGRVRLDCLRYLLDTGFLVDQKTGLATIKSGHLECLKLVHERGNAFDDKNAVETAAMNGHLECLMYILQNGGVATVSTASAAAAGGHVDCLQYILDQGVPLSTPMCNSAASGGSVECLKLLHARGCPWGKLCLKIAASRGNLACLKYLISQGATADASAAYAAVVNGKHFCLEFLLEKGCVVDKESVIEAVRRNRMHCLHILSRFEVPLDEAFALYFIKIVPNLTYIRLLVRAGYALPDLAVNDCMRYGVMHRCGGGWVPTLPAAATPARVSLGPASERGSRKKQKCVGSALLCGARLPHDPVYYE
eukprot:gene15025-17224_t